jgi:phosphomannomutase
MKISISGARGIYGKDLNLHEIYRLSSLFGSYLTNSKNKNIKCLVSCDTRISGDIIKKIVKSSLIERNIDVYDLGIAPTPIVFRESRKFDGSIIITASHNPFDWNGLKFLIDGRGIFEKELYEVFLSTQQISPIISYGSSWKFLSNYENDILELIQNSKELNLYNKKRICIDAGGGAACGYANSILKKIGHIVYDVSGNKGIFSRGPDPTIDDLSQLKSIVKSHNLDYGFSFDLDGDRLVVVNSSSEKLNSDITLLLCIANMLYSFQSKEFVTSIDTSISIQNFIKNHGSYLTYSKVGEANVVQKMIEKNADAGGEGSSAGFILPNFNMCRDAILASVLISTINKKILKECLEISYTYSQIRTKIQIDSELQKIILDKLYDEFKKDSTEINILDGIKIILDENSWILFRISNTEHVLRISIESTRNKINSIYKNVNERIIKIHDQIK